LIDAQGVFAWQFWGARAPAANHDVTQAQIINAPNYDEKTPMWQTLHIAFPASAHTITFTEKITAAQRS
jgi:hypothetical protein